MNEDRFHHRQRDVVRGGVGAGDNQALAQEPAVEQPGQRRVVFWSGGFDAAADHIALAVMEPILARKPVEAS